MERQLEAESLRNDLLRCMTQAKDRAEVGKRNEEKLTSLMNELNKYEVTKKALVECVNHCTSLYKAVEKYAQDRKQLSLDMLKTAIEKAGYIVPDANTEGIALKVVEKSAKIVNGLGQDINMREGTAFRMVLGSLIRYTLLKAQPNKIQAMFMDEAFNTLSETTQLAMREFIELFKDDILIIGIEQHIQLYKGMGCHIYRAVKSSSGRDGVTTIIDEGVESDV